MSMELDLISALGAAAIAGTLSAVVAKIAKLTSDLKAAQFKSDLQRSRTEFGINIAGIELRHQIEGQEVNEPLTEQLIAQVEDGILDRLSDVDGISKEQVKDEIEKKVKDIRSRLEQIEHRFPDTDKIDKISSINDALFAERIELLSKRLDSLESKQLGKWDVAIVVSLVITGISFVVGATYSVIVLFSAAA